MRIILFLLFLIIISACNRMQQTSLNELFEADREFSLQSTKIGFNNAFIEFAHDEAVLLRENSMPVKGKDAIQEIFKNANAEGVDFTWEPLDGNIAKSGEIGYTYGIFTIKTDSVVNKGTYVSIWKKNDMGEWKYILDSGNQGKAGFCG